ncbi:unnamed protein product [Phaeothamnion confervicola]
MSIVCTHADLTLAARQAREKLFSALNERFFAPRYNHACVTDVPGTGSRSLVFEMATFMHPDLSNLRYVDLLASTPDHAAVVKGRIRRGVLDLLTKEISGRQARGKAAEAAAVAEIATAAAEVTSGAGGTAAGQKRRAGATIIDFYGGKSAKAGTASTSRGLGLIGARVPDPAAAVPVRQLMEPRLAAEWKLCAYEQYAATAAAPKLTTLSLERLLDWWTRVGRKEHPEMFEVACTLLAVPASSGSLERDFSDAGTLVSGKRSGLKPSTVEMLLFLHGNHQAIPSYDHIPELKGDALAMAVPVRLRDPKIFTQMAQLYAPQPSKPTGYESDDGGFSSFGEDSDSDDEGKDCSGCSEALAAEAVVVMAAGAGAAGAAAAAAAASASALWGGGGGAGVGGGGSSGDFSRIPS